MRCQEFCLMPAACVDCETLFDAKHDFQEEEEIAEREFLRKVLLCWECRLRGRLKQ